MSANDLPPLRALVLFEAAVRHSSFKDAADELHLTPGAVSQQIKKLEAWLGFALFIRRTRRLQVTEQGVGYYSQVVPALNQIRQASHASRARLSKAVRLSLGTALAAKWLAPRMADFIYHHPEIDVHINATNHTVDFQSEEVDLAIRHFDGQDPTMFAQLLFAEEIRPLCSPAYRERLRLCDPDRLVDATLLHVSLYLSWDEWLDRFSSIGPASRASIPGLHFDQALLGIEARKARSGGGAGEYLAGRG